MYIIRCKYLSLYMIFIATHMIRVFYGSICNILWIFTLNFKVVFDHKAIKEKQDPNDHEYAVRIESPSHVKEKEVLICHLYNFVYLFVQHVCMIIKYVILNYLD